MVERRLPTTVRCMLLAAFMTPVSASNGAERRALNPAEKWVVAQVERGEVADLESALNTDNTKKFPEEKNRKLSVRFLEELLTGALPGTKIRRTGVRIQRAVIDEPLDLTNARIPCEVQLDLCLFKSDVTFRLATFAEAVSFDQRTFRAAADFNSAKVASYAAFRGATFEGPASFAGAEIGANLNISNACFNNEAEVA